MYKTCNGCRAMNDIGTEFKCQLNYPIETKQFQGVAVSARPLAECPKPRTYGKYMSLKMLRKA